MEYVKCDLCGDSNYAVIWDKQEKLDNGITVKSKLVRDPEGKVLNGRNVVCLNCGLVYVNPRMTREELEYFYANEYRKYYGSLGGDATHAANAYKVLDKYGLLDGKVLDVGCHTGKLVEMLKHGYGIEPNREAAMEAQTRGVNVGCTTVEQYQPPFLFDTATILNTLEHVASPTDVLEKINSLLIDGGHILVSVPNFFTKTIRQHPDVFLSCAHLYNFSIDTIKWFLIKCGFSPIAILVYAESIGEKLYVLAKKKLVGFELLPHENKDIFAAEAIHHLQKSEIVFNLKETILNMGFK